MKQTETFYITGKEWRIRWKANNEPFANAGVLQVYIYSAEGEPVSLGANQQGEGQDVSYVHLGPGGYYLAVNSANVDWELAVEQFAPHDLPTLQTDEHVTAISSNDVSEATPAPRVTGIPGEIQRLLDEWTSATVARDVDRLANCYAPRVDVYFLQSNIGREEVRADKEAAFNRYTDIIRYQISDVRLESINDAEAYVSFNKAWDARGVDRFFGNEREQLVLKIVGTSWKIAGERELRILQAIHTKV